MLSSLNARLFMLALAMVAPPFGLIIHSTVEQRVKAGAEAEQRALAIARQVAARQKDMMVQSRALLEGLAQNPVISRAGEAKACSALMADLRKVFPYYENLFVAGRDGSIRCSADPAGLSVKVADRSYFQRTLDTWSFTVGNFHKSRVSGADFLALAHPVFDGAGGVEAVVVAAVKPSWLNALLASTDLPEGAVATLVDSVGQIVARVPQGRGLVGELVPDLPRFLAIAQQRGEATTESAWLDGVTRIAGIAPLFEGGDGDLYVRVGLSREQAFAEVDRAFHRDLALLGLATLLFFAFGWVMSRFLVVHRVADVVRTARRLAAGEWHARTLLAPDQGELGELARVLNETAENLQLRQARIEEVERELRRSNRALRVLNGTTQALARSEDEQALLAAVCRVMVDSGGYALAWVGYAEDDENKSIRPIAHAGREDGYLALLNLSWAESEQIGPSGTAIRSAEPYIAQRIADDPRFVRWRDVTLAHGYASSISLPLVGDRVFGVLTVLAAEPDAFDAEEAHLLWEAAQELAFGIEVLRVHEGRRRAEDALQESEARLGQILQSIDSVVWSVTMDDGRPCYISPAVERIYGRPVEDFYQDKDLWSKVIHPDDRQQVLEGQSELLETGQLNRMYRILRPDGSVRWLDDRMRVRRDEAGRPLRIDGVASDVTEQRLLQESLRLRDQAIEASHNGLLIARLGQPPRIISVNPALLRLVDASESALLDQDLRVLLACGFDRGGWTQLSEFVRTRRDGQLLLESGENEGERRWFDVSVAMVDDVSGRTEHAVIEFRDVTENRHYQAEIERHANYDELTGLPNRNLLLDRLRQALAHAARSGGGETFVLWMNLDRFQAIDDSFGRQGCEQVLVELARRLAALMERHGTVARFEGDTFVLLVESMSSQEAFVSLLDRIQHAIRRPLRIQDQEVIVTASIGIAVAPGDGSDPDNLLRDANVSMIRAQENGQDGFCFYEEDMNARAMPRLRLEVALRQAVERDELHMVYQPKVDLQTGRVSGCEALVRWTHPEMGPVSPAEFIPLAEESGLILRIGFWVMEAVCAQLRQWLDAGLQCPVVAVNVSALQFQRSDLVSEVRGLLAAYRLDARLLMIEITESVLMTDPEQAIEMMKRLKESGIRLAIDDFGTGYSSLGALQRFPLDYLKIDRSFVSDLPASDSNAAIAGAIISLAHELNLQVTAEGVETEEQMMFLRARGCHEMQGYYFSRPVPADGVAALIREGRSLDFRTPPLARAGSPLATTFSSFPA